MHQKCYFCLYNRLKVHSKLSWILSASRPSGVSFRKVSLHCLGVLTDGYLNDVEKKKSHIEISLLWKQFRS